ncbi:MAG TPA: glutathione S-transferase N-terminal domain-containing protein [Gammaproteobacteria bacterium]|nr:glutathione S-transferase N-terminal domain-containing protein [Gammaproteobacteria bacterium]
MIDLYFWTTPNGYKVLLFLEESGIPYRVIPVNISKGEQFQAKFLKISPNNRIPAIVDHEPVVGQKPVSVFESGAILLYLAEKISRFVPTDTQGRANVLQWLFWQMGGLGPMAGQNMHFVQYAPEVLPYAINRYVSETSRLLKVLDRQLAGREYITGEYSIADMASYPWVNVYERLSQKLTDYSNLKNWHERIKGRPATIAAYAKGQVINDVPTVTEESRNFLFGRNDRTLAA